MPQQGVSLVADSRKVGSLCILCTRPLVLEDRYKEGMSELQQSGEAYVVYAHEACYYGVSSKH
jgi:hypothetical protein